MELNELLHRLVDGVSWSSQDNADEAHEAVDTHFDGPGKAASNVKADADAPAAPEGKKLP